MLASRGLFLQLLDLMIAIHPRNTGALEISACGTPHALLSLGSGGQLLRADLCKGRGSKATWRPAGSQTSNNSREAADAEPKERMHWSACWRVLACNNGDKSGLIQKWPAAHVNLFPICHPVPVRIGQVSVCADRVFLSIGKAIAIHVEMTVVRGDAGT